MIIKYSSLDSGVIWKGESSVCHYRGICMCILTVCVLLLVVCRVDFFDIQHVSPTCVLLISCAFLNRTLWIWLFGGKTVKIINGHHFINRLLLYLYSNLTEQKPRTCKPLNLQRVCCVLIYLNITTSPGLEMLRSIVVFTFLLLLLNYCRLPHLLPEVVLYFKAKVWEFDSAAFVLVIFCLVSLWIGLWCVKSKRVWFYCCLARSCPCLFMDWI